MKRSLAAGLFGLAFAAAFAARPAAPQATPVFGVGLEMIHVTVTARDAKGRLVSDLGAGDFAVREDGRPQKIQVFAPAAQPEEREEREELALNLGMLFDTSESMRREIKLSQESAIRFLDAIPRAKDLLLVFFDRDIRISRYSSENQQGIFERILGTEGSGYTALNDAIAIYLSRVADTPGRKVLVLFSDGDDTTSRINGGDVTALLRASDVVVYPVAFTGERPNSTEGLRAQAFLASLALDSGGQVFRPRASKELAAIYQSILEELGSQYVLGYVSGNTVRDGKFRRLTVEVRRPGVKLRHRPGYDAPRDEPPAARKKH